MCWLDDDTYTSHRKRFFLANKTRHTHTNAMNIVLTCFGYRIIYDLIRISAQQFMIHTYMQHTHR